LRYQSATVVIDIVGMSVDMGGHLGSQCRGQHLPCAVADDLIEQRRASSTRY
jgi:hypothetical protein